LSNRAAFAKSPKIFELIAVRKKLSYDELHVSHQKLSLTIKNGTRNAMSDNIDDIIESSSIEELKILIKKAESAIEQKKAGEIASLRDQMYSKARLYDMTPEEVLSFSFRKRRSPGVPKYRNPANPEQTWTGRGKPPHWLKEMEDPESCRIPE
jgi:DNA-binding protein H-NS